MSQDQQDKSSINPCICAAGGKSDPRCRICRGSGVVVHIGAQQFFWDKKINIENIRFERVERGVKIALAMSALIGTLAGVASLGWLGYRAVDIKSLLNHLASGSDLMALPVWMGMLAASYFIYHVKKENSSRADLGALLRRMRTEHHAHTKGKHSIGFSKYFSESALHCITHAYLLARKLGHARASALHLFASCLTDPAVALLVARLAVDKTKLIGIMKHVLAKQERQRIIEISNEWNKVLCESFLRAFEHNHSQVFPTDLVVALASPEYKDNDAILTECDLTRERVEHVADWVELQRELVRRRRRFYGRAAYKPIGAMNRAYTSIATPILDRFSRDLTMYAAHGAMQIVVGRDQELSQVYRALQSGGRGVLLVGVEGAGKSAVIGQIAQAMASEDVPEIMRDRRFIELSVPALVAGGGSSGGMEKTLLMMAREIRRAGNVILVVENAHALVGTKSEGGAAFDVASVLAEELEHGSLTLIATTTPDAVQIVAASALGKPLERIEVGETDREATIKVLESKAPLLEHRYRVFFSYPAIEKIVDSATRYLSEGAMPDKAVKLLEEVGETVKEERGDHAMVTNEDVAAVVSQRTSIPLTALNEDERGQLLHLEDKLHERVIGQEEAVSLVANAIRRSRADLRERKRPIASFLFLGPTGVGKTEVARTLAATYFGQESAMVRLDMTEYQGQDALEKLLGNKSSNTQGYLTEAVRRKPFSLVLLDEFEKASGETLNLFLQVLEDGRLTDAQGKTANFANTIIIATSNAGADTILTGLRGGTAIEEIRDKLIQDELPRRFRPELINRFDGVVVFKPLSISDVEAITRLVLKRVEKELNERGIALKVEEVAVHDLAREGYDPAYGARPLKRLVQERVENPVSEMIVAGSVKHRDVIILEYGGKPRIEKAPPL